MTMSATLPHEQLLGEVAGAAGEVSSVATLAPAAWQQAGVSRAVRVRRDLTPVTAAQAVAET